MRNIYILCFEDESSGQLLDLHANELYGHLAHLKCWNDSKEALSKFALQDKCPVFQECATNALILEGNAFDEMPIRKFFRSLNQHSNDDIVAFFSNYES